jgi:hypothetical protein
MLPDILDDKDWLMMPGERAAIKGLLAELRPALAIDIGTSWGGSVRRIAAVAGHVHTFDLVRPPKPLPILDNVSFHIGDSHVLLPKLLAQLADERKNVDFVLVDGDHTPEGVKRDVEDLLASPAISRTVILLHDTTNPDVRAGLEAVDYAAWPRVAQVDLDWIPGYMLGEELDVAWCGLGMILVDPDHEGSHDDVWGHYAGPMSALLPLLDQTRSALEEHDASLQAIYQTRAWRVVTGWWRLKRLLKGHW